VHECGNESEVALRPAQGQLPTAPAMILCCGCKAEQWTRPLRRRRAARRGCRHRRARGGPARASAGTRTRARRGPSCAATRARRARGSAPARQPSRRGVRQGCLPDTLLAGVCAKVARQMAFSPGCARRRRGGVVARRHARAYLGLTIPAVARRASSKSLFPCLPVRVCAPLLRSRTEV